VDVGGEVSTVLNSIRLKPTVLPSLAEARINPDTIWPPVVVGDEWAVSNPDEAAPLAGSPLRHLEPDVVPRAARGNVERLRPSAAGLLPLLDLVYVASVRDAQIRGRHVAILETPATAVARIARIPGPAGIYDCLGRPRRAIPLPVHHPVVVGVSVGPLEKQDVNVPVVRQDRIGSGNRARIVRGRRGAVPYLGARRQVGNVDGQPSGDFRTVRIPVGPVVIKMVERSRRIAACGNEVDPRARRVHARLQIPKVVP